MTNNVVMTPDKGRYWEVVRQMEALKTIINSKGDQLSYCSYKSACDGRVYHIEKIDVIGKWIEQTLKAIDEIDRKERHE